MRKHNSSQLSSLELPGSATVVKGEPWATDLASLRFPLGREQNAHLNDEIGRSLDYYADLAAGGEAARQARAEELAATMQEMGITTTLVERY